MSNITNTRPIFPDYAILPLAEGNGQKEFRTYLRKKHRGKWYEQHISYFYHGDDIGIPLATKQFIKSVYSYLILGRVGPSMSPFRLSEDQRSEEERLTKILTT